MDGRKIRTCLSGSIDAKPPECEAWPPLEAIFCTSSLGRLAKFPGLVLADIVVLGLRCADLLLDYCVDVWFRLELVSCDDCR